MRLGHELATGLEHGWDYLPVEASVAASAGAAAASSRAASVATIHRPTQDYGRSRSFLAHANSKVGRDSSTGRELTLRQSPGGLVRSSHKRGRDCRAIVTLQIDWSRIPRRRLRRHDMLESAVADAHVAALWLLERYPGRPLVMAGFSFGGPSMWGAIGRLPAAAPLAGAASIAGSARGGSTYEDTSLDTVGCIRACSERALASKDLHDTISGQFLGSAADGEEVAAEGEESEAGDCAAANAGRVAGPRILAPAALFLHGTHDKEVALQVAEYLHSAAGSPRSLVRINGATHMFDSARDLAYETLRTWVLESLNRWWVANSDCREPFKALFPLWSPAFRAASAPAPPPLPTIPFPSGLGAAETAAVAASALRAAVAGFRPQPGRIARAAPLQRLSSAPAQPSSIVGTDIELGREMRVRDGERPGQERWRVKPSRRRVSRVAVARGHPLRGLVGYSE